MIIDISVGVIALAFVILVIFLIRTLVQLRKTLKKLGKVSDESVILMKDINALTVDVKHKSEALDVLFRPLQMLKKERAGHSHSTVDRLAEMVDNLSKVVILFFKLREGK